MSEELTVLTAKAFVDLARRQEQLAGWLDQFYESMDYLGVNMDVDARRQLFQNARDYMERVASKLQENEKRLLAQLEQADEMRAALVSDEPDVNAPMAGEPGNLADALEPDNVDGEAAAQQWDEAEPATSDILQDVEGPNAEASLHGFGERSEEHNILYWQSGPSAMVAGTDNGVADATGEVLEQELFDLIDATSDGALPVVKPSGTLLEFGAANGDEDGNMGEEQTQRLSSDRH